MVSYEEECGFGGDRKQKSGIERDTKGNYRIITLPEPHNIRKQGERGANTRSEGDGGFLIVPSLTYAIFLVSTHI